MQPAVGYGGLRQVRTHVSAAMLARLIIKRPEKTLVIKNPTCKPMYNTSQPEDEAEVHMGVAPPSL